MFKERSVVWADRMVAISSSNAFLCASSVTAGYSSRNRSTVSFARTLAPRGGGGVIQDFLGLGGAKQSACHGSDLRSVRPSRQARRGRLHDEADRKSTRLNSSHSQISYAVFCLK